MFVWPPPPSSPAYDMIEGFPVPPVSLLSDMNCWAAASPTIHHPPDSSLDIAGSPSSVGCLAAAHADRGKVLVLHRHCLIIYFSNYLCSSSPGHSCCNCCCCCCCQRPLPHSPGPGASELPLHPAGLLRQGQGLPSGQGPRGGPGQAPRGRVQRPGQSVDTTTTTVSDGVRYDSA